MGARGPKPKKKPPKRLKYQSGIPAAPRWMTKNARAEYARVAKLLEGANVLQQVDFAVLRSYAVAYDEVEQLTRELAKEGMTVFGMRSEVLNPKVRARQIAHTQMLQSAAKLGMSPYDRDRITIEKKDKEEDGIDDFLRGA